MNTVPGPPLRCGHPIWLDADRAPTARYASLRGHHEAAVAIVGGGMTGALVASMFADAGVPVALVEGALVGRGSTAASSALLLQEPDRGLTELARRYGRETSRRLWQLSSDAVRDLIAMLRRLRIACDLVQRDAIYYATNDAAVVSLRAELERRLGAGFRGDWLTPPAVRRATGVAAAGAIRTRGNAQFDPYKACVGVIARAAESGAAIFERSPVTRIEARRHGVRVHTRGGRIDADRVIVATGYATNDFRPLAGRFRMLHTYVLATPPLTRSQQRALGLGPVMMWDTERPYHYARWTPDRRLLLGGGDRRVRAGVRRDRQFATATRALRDDFEALLPGLADIGIERAWEGLFAMTPDSLPYIGPHQRYPRHLFALGYGGNGMTFGFLAARLLLDVWRGRPSADAELFRFGRVR
jgi:glycine/D-amino acid oxidase-like deaminating enzyme